VASTAAFKVGDFHLLKDESDWTSVGGAPVAGIKKGEVVRIEALQSGTVLNLGSPLCDPYRVANTAKIAKLNYLTGHYLADFTHYNVTPEYGIGAGINFRYCAGGHIERLITKKGVGSSINFYNSMNFDVDRCDFRDGNYQTTAADGSSVGFGYGVSANQATQDIRVNNCRGLKGHGGVWTHSAAAGDYGVVRHCTISDGRANEYYQMPFHTHETGEYVDFIDCRASRGSYDGSSGAYEATFGMKCRNSKIINPVVEGAHGCAIELHNTGLNCMIINPVVHKVYKSGRVGTCGIEVKAPGTTIHGGVIDGVTDASTPDDILGSGIVFNSDATGCVVEGTVIKNTSGPAISDSDATGSLVVDGVVGVNNGRNVIYASGARSGNYRNVRSVNSSRGLTNQPAGLQNRQRPLAPNVPGWDFLVGSTARVAAPSGSSSTSRNATATNAPSSPTASSAPTSSRSARPHRTPRAERAEGRQGVREGRDRRPDPRRRRRPVG
jgi:hypothetical protein